MFNFPKHLYTKYLRHNTPWELIDKQLSTSFPADSRQFYTLEVKELNWNMKNNTWFNFKNRNL